MADGILLQDGSGVLLLQDGDVLLVQSQPSVPLVAFTDLIGATGHRQDCIGGNYRHDTKRSGRGDVIGGNYRHDMRQGKGYADQREQP